MNYLARASLLAAAVLLTTSCSDTDARLTTGPSSVGAASLEIVPTASTAFAQPAGDPACPGVPPFNVAFGFSVKTTGWSSVIVTRLRAQFTDSSGVRAPEVTLPAPGPTPIFGDSMLPGASHTFPLILAIGCGTGARGTLIVVVDASDGGSRRGSGQIAIAVR